MCFQQWRLRTLSALSYINNNYVIKEMNIWINIFKLSEKAGDSKRFGSCFLFLNEVHPQFLSVLFLSLEK